MPGDVASRAARLIAAALALVLLVGACASAENGSSDGSGTGEVAAAGEASFCALWAEMNALTDDPDGIDQDGLNAYLEAREAAAAELPPELADEWDVIVAWDDQFVEIVYAVDFDWDAITEEIVAQSFGSAEKAEAAEADQEAAVGTIDRWLVGNCGSGEENALTFCSLWTDIYLTLEGYHPDPNMDPQSSEALNRRTDLVAEADAVVPSEVREHWDPVAHYYLTLHDLLLTVDFEESLISDELLTDAFGSPEAAASAAAEAEASVVAVEAWAVTGCGDFCARSRELLNAVDMLGGPLDQRVKDPYVFAQTERSLAHTDALMPDELIVLWEPVSAEIEDWMGWWERHDYDMDQLNAPEAQLEAIEIYRQAEYQSVVGGADPESEAVDIASIEAWRRGEAELTEEAAGLVHERAVAEPWQRPGFAAALHEMNQWAEFNCGGATGGPGVVEVRFSEISGAAGDEMVLVIGPVGSTVADLARPEQFLAGVDCLALDRDPWGVHLAHEDEAGRPEYWYRGEILRPKLDEDTGEELCGWHGQEVPLEPGTYTLLAARYEGATPRPGVEVLPTHCLALDVTVAGDTLVELPELPECDVVQAPTAPGEWGYVEPVSTSTPGAGTLKLRIPAPVAPAAEGDFAGGGRYHLQAIVLPQGTTLNDVGSERVFPPAAGCAWLWSQGEFPGEVEMRPVELPLGSLPVVGLRSCLDPDWLNGAQPIPGAPAGEPADDSKLPLTLLAPGVYDVYVSGFWEGWAHEMSCFTGEATVDGDTVVDLPDLGEMERC